MAQEPGLIRLAVFGSPVAHSLSPSIHRRFAHQCGLAVDYRAIEASEATFDQQVRDFANSGARGCNITLPFKHRAWKLARRCSPSAVRAEAANTLIFETQDDWLADNTDGRGLMKDLELAGIGPLARRRILILGAGGATSGILGDLLDQGPAEVVIGNRSAERATDLAGKFGASGRARGSGFKGLDDERAFHLVINATSLGHSGEVPPLSPRWFAAGALCYDLNYGKAAAPLRDYCERNGIAYRDGLGMLVGQAAVSFNLWTGRQPDSGAVLREMQST